MESFGTAVFRQRVHAQIRRPIRKLRFLLFFSFLLKYSPYKSQHLPCGRMNACECASFHGNALLNARLMSVVGAFQSKHPQSYHKFECIQALNEWLLHTKTAQVFGIITGDVRNTRESRLYRMPLGCHSMERLSLYVGCRRS